MFKLFHILTRNKINYVLYDGLNFLYDKSQNFMELLLKLRIFFIKKVALIRTIKLILLIIKLHSKGLERNIRDMGANYMTLFDVLIGF